MYKIVTIVFFVFVASIAFGQKDQRQKSFYFELAGSGGLGSINFERNFLKKEKTEFTFRAGFSIAPIDKNNGFGLVFPVMVNFLLGQTHINWKWDFFKASL